PSDILVHLYGQSTARVPVNGREVSLRQWTKYPWDGEVRFEIDVASPQRFAVHLRVPAWCERWHVAVNGEHASRSLKNELLVADGYIQLEREWNPGDV